MPVVLTDSDGNFVYPLDFEKCNEMSEALHSCVSRDTKFPLLIDRIRVHAIGYILSIGDILLTAGTLLMTLQRMWIFLPRKKPH